MALRIGAFLIFFTFHFVGLTQSPDLSSMIRTLELEVATLDRDYLDRIAGSNPFLILYFHYLHTRSWEMRTHPDQKQTPITFPVIAADDWQRQSLLDLELQGLLQRKPDREAIYRIGEERRFLVLQSTAEVLKNVNAQYAHWTSVNATQE